MALFSVLNFICSLSWNCSDHFHHIVKTGICLLFQNFMDETMVELFVEYFGMPFFAIYFSHDILYTSECYLYWPWIKVLYWTTWRLGLAENCTFSIFYSYLEVQVVASL